MNPPAFWIGLTMALGSAASMALEIVAGRLMAPYVGMSLYSWTAIIAVVLSGLSAGHWLGGILADRMRPPRVAGWALVAAAFSAYGSLYVLRVSARPVLEAVEPVTAMSLIALAAFLLPSLFAGVLAPVLTRIALGATPENRQGRVLGRMFALGAVGAILGTVAAGFWLISFIGSAGTVLAIALTYAVLAVPFFAGRARAAPVLALAALGLGASAGPARLQALSAPCTVESDYFCIRVDDFSGLGPRGRLLALDHLVHGVNAEADPGLLISPYVQLVDEMARLRLGGRAPAAYFVGGGAYTLPRAWAARHPGADLVVAELDPEVTRVARERLWLDTGALEVIHQDGRAALEALPPERRFDIIFGDAFHDVAIPQHLVTDEFHALVKSRLTEDGIYALNVVEALREPPFLLSLVRTLQSRFQVVELWLDRESIRPTEGRTVWIVFASDRDSGLRALEARHGLARNWVRVPTEAMLAVLPRERQIFLTDDHAPVNRLMRHILTDKRLAE